MGDRLQGDPPRGTGDRAPQGGIAEPEGEFSVQETGFWLFPTQFHVQPEKLNPRGRRLLIEESAKAPAAAESDLTPAEVTLDTFCQIESAIHLARWWQVCQVVNYQTLSLETLEERFHYRAPGLHLLLLKAYREPPFQVAVSPEMAGCRSWLTLPPDVPEPSLQQAAVSPPQLAEWKEEIFLAIDREPL